MFWKFRLMGALSDGACSPPGAITCALTGLDVGREVQLHEPRGLDPGVGRQRIEREAKGEAGAQDAAKLEQLPVSLHAVTHIASDLIDVGPAHKGSSIGSVGLLDVKAKALGVPCYDLLGGKIRDLKGPPTKDAVLLQEAGRLIMQGLHTGMQSAWVAVEAWLKGRSTKITETVREMADAAKNGTLETKFICRTFSDCTTAPRNGLISGCYPLDKFYTAKPEFQQLKDIKKNVGA